MLGLQRRVEGSARNLGASVAQGDLLALFLAALAKGDLVLLVHSISSSVGGHSVRPVKLGLSSI